MIRRFLLRMHEQAEKSINPLTDFFVEDAHKSLIVNDEADTLRR